MPPLSEDCCYSPIRHLATILWPPWLDRENAILAMVTFAFDASGDDSRPYLTMAGFASSAKDWDDFSAAWSERLKQDDIEFFHAADLDGFWGPFKHWQDNPDRRTLRKNLCADLMNILKRHVYQRFASTVINNEFQQMTADLRDEFALCAYSLAGRTCEKQVREYILSHFTRDTPFAVVFEAGDKGKGKLQKRLAEDSGLVPTFRRKKDTILEDGLVERGFIPLQAADWFAYEVNKMAEKFGDGSLKSESQLRWPMQEFLRNPPGPLGVFLAENIKDLRIKMEATKETISWEKALGLGKKRDSLRSNANTKGKAAQ